VPPTSQPPKPEPSLWQRIVAWFRNLF
jgi:hypothetical protein